MRLFHLVPAGVVLVALGAIAGAAQLAHPATPGPDSAATVTRQVAVTSAARACPPAQGNGSGPVALIAGATGATGPGTAAGGLGGSGGQGSGRADRAAAGRRAAARDWPRPRAEPGRALAADRSRRVKHQQEGRLGG